MVFISKTLSLFSHASNMYTNSKPLKWAFFTMIAVTNTQLLQWPARSQRDVAFDNNHLNLKLSAFHHSLWESAAPAVAIQLCAQIQSRGIPSKDSGSPVIMEPLKNSRTAHWALFTLTAVANAARLDSRSHICGEACRCPRDWMDIYTAGKGWQL